MVVKRRDDLGKTFLVGVKLIHPEVESDNSVVNIQFSTEQRPLDPIETISILAAGISVAIKAYRSEELKDYVMLSSVINQLEADFISTTNFEDAEIYETWKERRKLV